MGHAASHGHSQQRQETGSWVLAHPSSSQAANPSFDLAPAEPTQM